MIRRHGISFHSYADDTQLYAAVSPDDTGSIDSLFKRILDFNVWKLQNILHLNQEKTEILVIDSKAQREKLVVKLNSLGLTPSQQARNLGVGFVTKSAFYHVKILPKCDHFYL